jgi:NAD(P)-dependent dehydrogenase (short-subunit alcohol dehydrogenase family)
MLTDQVVLITGCSSGIGQALASELAQRGNRVFASARQLEGLRELRGKPGIESVLLDVTDPASMERAVAEVVQRAGRIDLLVNNAGFNLIGPLAEVPLEGVRRLFETNVTGLLALIQTVFPRMAERRSGRIVNLGSVVGLLPTPFAGPYCATKAAVHMLSEVLRMELAPFGIDVIVVQPGGVRSSIADTASKDLTRYAEPSSHYRPAYAGIEQRARASQDRPMEAAAFAREIADAILAERAARVVRAGRGARLYPALSRLPAVARDKVLSRKFGLDSLRARS